MSKEEYQYSIFQCIIKYIYYISSFYVNVKKKLKTANFLILTIAILCKMCYTTIMQCITQKFTVTTKGGN